MTTTVDSLPRRMWRALEPYQAVIYFAPEPREATDALGCRGGWMSYFALRAAPLGAVPAEVVTAAFYNFHPGRVARAIPAAWQAGEPQRFLEARLRSVDAALHRLLGPEVAEDGIAEAAELARQAALAAPTVGRVLAAANAALDWPDEPHLVLWHAQNLLRESRGDAHVAALLVGGLDPCEALVAFAAEGRAKPDELREVRGWSPQEWQAATERLQERGLLTGDGWCTARGNALRAQVEEWTDAASWAPWSALGAERTARLETLTAPLVRRIVAGGGFLSPNPMGLESLEPPPPE